MKEFLRKVYNHIIYSVLRFLFLWSKNLEFFSGTNGWSFTFRYKNSIYKCFNLPFLFHPINSFKTFVAFHKHLIMSGVEEYVPVFYTRQLYIKYNYIPQTRNLVQAFLEEPVVEERINLLVKVLKMIEAFHVKDIVHGDLKPKNILVTPDSRLYVIDFENSFISKKVTDREIDYRKLIPRLIYLFTALEFKHALDLASPSVSMRVYIERFITPFDVRQCINGIPNLTFETNTSQEGEDIDIHVLNKNVFIEIIQRLNVAGLDHFLFYRSPQNIKVFIFNLSAMVELDVHLNSAIPKLEFLFFKIIRHPAHQIMVTGPDGVGKTTLLGRFLENSDDSLLSRIPSRIVHTSRLARHERGAESSFNLLERLLDRISLGLFTRLCAYVRLLQTNTAPLILFDRSFYDPFIQAKTNVMFRAGFIFQIFFPRNVTLILLKASSETVFARKSELSRKLVDNYYMRAQSMFPPHLTLSTEEGEPLFSQFTFILRYFVLTEKRFRI